MIQIVDDVVILSLLFLLYFEPSRFYCTLSLLVMLLLLSCSVNSMSYRIRVSKLRGDSQSPVSPCRAQVPLPPTSTQTVPAAVAIVPDPSRHHYNSHHSLITITNFPHRPFSLISFQRSIVHITKPDEPSSSLSSSSFDHCLYSTAN